MGVVIFNGISSENLGFQVEHPPGYNFPEREYEVTHVPGRNGDIVIDKNSYKNVKRSYEIAFYDPDLTFSEQIAKLSDWLHSASTYAELTDSYDADYYRMAMYQESGEIESILDQMGRITINFDCKPQRYLNSGKTATSFTASGTITNPTSFSSAPVITVKGASSATADGVLTVNGFKVTIAKASLSGNSITIDSEILDCYSGSANRNSAVTLEKGFPKLGSGVNTISISGGIASVSIVPNWWRL